MCTYMQRTAHTIYVSKNTRALHPTLDTSLKAQGLSLEQANYMYAPGGNPNTSLKHLCLPLTTNQLCPSREPRHLPQVPMRTI